MANPHTRHQRIANPLERGNNKEVNVSNIVDIVAAAFGIVFWEVSLAYLVIDVGSMVITGNSIGDHIDRWCGGPIYKKE